MTDRPNPDEMRVLARGMQSFARSLSAGLQLTLDRLSTLFAPTLAKCLIAMEWHAAREQFAPDYGAKPRGEPAVPWPDLPERDRALMLVTVHNLLRRGIIAPGPKLTKHADPLRRNGISPVLPQLPDPRAKAQQDGT